MRGEELVCVDVRAVRIYVFANLGGTKGGCATDN